MLDKNAIIRTRFDGSQIATNAVTAEKIKIKPDLTASQKVAQVIAIVIVLAFLLSLMGAISVFAWRAALG